MDIAAIVMGVVSFVLAQFTSIPQLFELKRTRNSSGISLWTYIIFNITSIVWVVWSFCMYFNALANQSGELTHLFQWTLLPAVIMNVSNIFTMSYVLGIKIKYMTMAKKMNITELELSKILLDKDRNKYLKNGKMNNFKRFGSEIALLTITTLILTALTLVLCFFGLVKISGAEKWTKWVMVINAIGAISWEAVSWPQFIKSIKEKDTTGVSMGWAIFLPVSCLIMFTYDLTMSLSGDSGFNYAVLFSLIFNGMISSFGVLILKIINIVKAKKMNLSEIEYTKQYLIPMVKEKAKQKQLKKQQKSKSN